MCIRDRGNAPLNDDGTFVRNKVKSRQDADFPVVEPSEVDLMDVSPQQIASIAASLDVYKRQVVWGMDVCFQNFMEKIVYPH